MTSRSTWTHNLKHLVNEKPFISQAPARRLPQGPPKVKGVAHPRDRIKFWNIQPGDKVCMFRGNLKPDSGKHGRVFEVHDVDKRRNLLEIKDLPSKNRSLGTKTTERVHYSNVGLYMGKFPVQAEVDGRDSVRERDVFATRLITTEPKWDPHKGHYAWRRFAASTWPVIAGYEKRPYGKRRRARSSLLGRSTLIEIPWPIQKRWQPPEASPILDTLIGAVKNVSWLPATPWMTDLSGTSISPNPHRVERDYLRASLDPNLWAKLPADLPMEVFLIQELANPSSRSKKQARWQARLAANRDLRRQMLRTEIKDLCGRTRSIARREAMFRWKAHLEGSKKVTDGAWAGPSRNERQRTKRAMSKEQRLEAVVLPFRAQNQVIPVH